MAFRNPNLLRILTLDLSHSVKYDFDIPSSCDLRHGPLVVTLVTFSHLHLGLVNPSFSDMIPIPPELTSTSTYAFFLGWQRPNLITGPGDHLVNHVAELFNFFCTIFFCYFAATQLALLH